MESLIIIPARGGSKGIPGKNMALLGGKPLIEHTIRAALDAELPARICLTTDDIDIRNFGLSFPIEVPFLRPSELALDSSDMSFVIRHALDWYVTQEHFIPRYIVLLQPTSPLRTSRNINEAYQIIVTKDGHSIIGVNLVNEHPCEYIVQRENGFEYVMVPPELPGRQNFPNIFFINGAIYIVSKIFFDKTGLIYDNKSLLYFMERQESVDINTLEDLYYANCLYERIAGQKE